jgi:hypothetical protein
MLDSNQLWTKISPPKPPVEPPLSAKMVLNKQNTCVVERTTKARLFLKKSADLPVINRRIPRRNYQYAFHLV